MKQFIICLYWERENEREYALNLKIDHQWEILAQYIYCDLMMDLNHIKISANSFNQVNIKKKKSWWRHFLVIFDCWVVSVMAKHPSLILVRFLLCSTSCKFGWELYYGCLQSQNVDICGKRILRPVLPEMNICWCFLRLKPESNILKIFWYEINDLLSMFWSSNHPLQQKQKTPIFSPVM